ncbi:hypothetical protein V1520DRAFT_381848 [Lipomyces starkeyi]|uniref:DnaJ homologue subfamily C member 28 conserved domain-containing protein n=1 Tax=Lipomyces starkeyi NRRL Y-11557 TaxID=675824 RepID=A0A1E3Q7A3_LIPST|nr:hypothetical protein LIPSTDRAFT_81593 [Lipomyces starkeyi NRRL Y-11557]
MKYSRVARLYFSNCSRKAGSRRSLRFGQTLAFTKSCTTSTPIRQHSTTPINHVSAISENNEPNEAPESEQSKPTIQPNSIFDARDIGYMKRRLSQLAEEASPIKDDPMAGRAPDDEFMSVKELKDLEERLSAKTFEQEYAQAIAGTQLPKSASKHTQDLAFSKPWTGRESTEDAVLRMLVDSNKPLRIPGGGIGQRVYKASGGAGAETCNTVPLPKTKRSTPDSVRLARARELSLEYSIAKNTGTLSGGKDKDKQKDGKPFGQVEEDTEFSRLYKDRFRGPRAMPGTLHGLRALADERIEEARSRGQFNNLPRGEKLDMDARISSPFLDTTEFFLNRIIQRQDVQPPWIEKLATIRQDLRRFRIGLRESWKRHAMQLIAATSPNLEAQMARARNYAEAERSEAERLGLYTEKDKDVGESTQQANEGVAAEVATSTETDDLREEPVVPTGSTFSLLPKYDWESIEHKYHVLSVKTLNDSIRSYNLMAPGPARRSYLTLERELRLCYAEVAPLMADALRERHELIKSGRTTFTLKKTENTESIVNNLFGEKVAIMEKTGNEYGLKELFRDLFFRKKSSSL